MDAFIPGIPIKRHNPCVDPLQSKIPHIITSLETTETGDVVDKGYIPNSHDYPEYEFIIQEYIEAKLNKRGDVEKLLEEKDYNAGLLNDYGGGNVLWWQGYIRAEIDRCNEYWRSNIKSYLKND